MISLPTTYPHLRIELHISRKHLSQTKFAIVSAVRINTVYLYWLCNYLYNFRDQPAGPTADATIIKHRQNHEPL